MKRKGQVMPETQDPTSGGRYVREADGTLRLIHKTEPAVGRANRAPAEQPAQTQDGDETVNEE